MATIDEKYLSFETFRRDGTGVSTPVWCVPLDDGRFGFWTSSVSGKAKRLSHTERVRFQPCDGRGNVVEGTTPTEGTARLVDGPEYEDIRRRVVAKYGFMTKVTKLLWIVSNLFKPGKHPYGDRGVIVTPGGTAAAP